MSKAATAMKHPRQRWAAYLAFIRGLPCVICGNPHTEAAHLRMASRLAGKRQTGMGEKPDDRWALPLCSEHHREQHQGNELAFWLRYGIDWPAFLSLAVQASYPESSEAETLIGVWRQIHGLTGGPGLNHSPSTE